MAGGWWVCAWSFSSCAWVRALLEIHEDENEAGFGVEGRHGFADGCTTGARVRSVAFMAWPLRSLVVEEFAGLDRAVGGGALDKCAAGHGDEVLAVHHALLAHFDSGVDAACRR